MDNKAVIEIQTKMKTWTDAGIELAYNSGYEQGCKDRDEIYAEDKEDYNRGLNDAWECAHKIDTMTIEECEKVFGEYRYFATIAYNLSASEAIAKMKEYEDKQEVDRIMDLPSVEQESKTGHWIKSNIPNEEYVCSECGGACWYYDYQANVAKSRYCPNCGAKMVEPQESEDKE